MAASGVALPPARRGRRLLSYSHERCHTGFREAIGAKRSDINKQFLIEAMMLTFIGGFIGILLGCLVSFGVTYLGILQASVSISSIILAFCVSAGIGIVFGYYPARRAGQLNPIDALRYE